MLKVHQHTVEKRESLSHLKIFREINSLVSNLFSKTNTFTEFLSKKGDGE